MTKNLFYNFISPFFSMIYIRKFLLLIMTFLIPISSVGENI